MALPVSPAAPDRLLAGPRPAVSSISMVLPAYNEETNIECAVLDAERALALTGRPYEIIVVNDGSHDRTGEVLDRLAKTRPELVVVHLERNQGYGGALRAGFACARHEWIFQSDSDRQFDYAEVSRLIGRAERHDFVLGYRRPRRDPLVRRLNGWGWNRLVRLVCGPAARDIDCAFRLFRRSALSQIALTSNGAMISTELVVGARARGFEITEVAVTHLPRPAGHATGANLRVILRALRDLARYRLMLNRQPRTAGQTSAPLRQLTHSD